MPQTGSAQRRAQTSAERRRREGAVVSTLIPARLERLPWGRFHALVVAALGVTWILDGLEVTLAGSVAGALKLTPALRFSDTEVGLAGSAYLSGAVVGRAVLRLADRPARPQEAVLHHHRRLPDGDRGDGRGVGRRLLFRLPLPHRRGHRRGIRRHQFDDPGADPRPLPRPAGSDDQRQLLGRGGARGAGRGRAPQPRPVQSRVRLAARLPHRRGSRRRRLRDAHVDPGEPAMARHPRAGGRGRSGRRRHRKAVPRRRRPTLSGPRERRDPAALPDAYAARGSVRHAGQPLPACGPSSASP